jgi:tetratricopeptide (TPR) repeat protein
VTSSPRRRRSKSSVDQRRDQLRGLIGFQFKRVAHAIRTAGRFVLGIPGRNFDGLKFLLQTAAGWLRLPSKGAAAVRRKNRSIKRRPLWHSPWLVALVRHWRLALAGLPALAALVGVVLLAAMRTFSATDPLLGRYIEAANAAVAAGDFAKAAICFERTLTFNPDEPGYRYAFAVSIDALGDGDRALAIMRGLAPENSNGYGRAHWWQARKLMETGSTADPQVAARIESHLLRVGQSSPDLPELQIDKARFYLTSGRLHEVETDQKLMQVVRTEADLRLNYAKLLVLSGRVVEARNEAVSLLGDLRTAVEHEPASWERRLLLAETYGFLRQYGAAVGTLRQAAALTDSKSVVRLTAQIYGSWMDTTADDPKASADVAARAFEQLAPRAEEESTTAFVSARAAETLGRQAEAERLFRRAAELQPVLRFELVRYYQRRNRPDDARREASAAVADAEAATAARPADLSQKLLAADGAMLLGEYQRAIDLLKAAGANTSAKLGPAISRAYVAWWRERRRVDPAEDSWHLVKEALAADPWNVDLLEDLVKEARGDGPQAELADRKLREMLARADAPAPLHLVVGTDAVERGDLQAARTHLVQAFKLDSSSAEAANNLAWALVHHERPDPQTALELANFALEKQPGRPNFLDTRGHVYMALKRWQDALADFEACRSAMQGTPSYHRALATTYGKLGLAEMAAEHERMAAGEEKPKQPDGAAEKK